MNNFTKEELAEIHRCLKYMIKGGSTPYSCLTLDIKKKVHYLMQHQHLSVWHCEKCGHVQ